MSDDERVIAYVDGELAGEARVAFEAQMSADPALAAEVARHRALAARVAVAYAPVLEEPVPPRLTALAGAANDRGPIGRPAWPQWAAMAACLVLGVAAGRAFWPEQGPLAARGGELLARGALDRALTTALASEPGGAIRVGLTFKAADGRYCRTFESPADRLAGLACRRDGRWRAQTTTAWAPPPASAYRQAASELPPAVLAAVDGLSAGPSLDAAAERAARDRGWSP
ncbi:MAG TPA: hypothetical protein VIE16_04395 [Phenylobacterium sp.]|jgi:hypothetical protein